MFKDLYTLYVQVSLRFGYTDLGLLRNLGNITAKSLYNRGYAGYLHLWRALSIEQNS